MRVYELIVNKRDGKALDGEEIRFLVNGYTGGEIPDYQMAAFLMAVYFQGMTPAEITALTLAMAESGEMLDLSAVPGIKVDKHSTGGVGDKTTLVAVPIAAAAGLAVGKMSGRSLGHTGGTLDKLESIPGMRTNLDRDEFLGILRQVGAVITGQTGNLTPADKQIYALRDVTGTVESIPLIAASIMSKKIAAGADAFVLDVKVGRAAFMRTRNEARELAEQMVAIAEGVGREAVAWITAMDQPLGRAVGNALEVYEAVDVLKGEGPSDLRDLSLVLAGEMLFLGGVVEDQDSGCRLAERALRTGAAWEKLKAMIDAQGGESAFVDRPPHDRLPAGVAEYPVKVKDAGWIRGIDGREVGLAAMALGAGRTRKEDAVEVNVGVVLNRKRGERVDAGDVVASVYATEPQRAEVACTRVREAYEISEEKPEETHPLFIERVAGANAGIRASAGE